MPGGVPSLEDISLDILTHDINDQARGEHSQSPKIFNPPCISGDDDDVDGTSALPVDLGNRLLERMRQKHALNSHSLRAFNAEQIRISQANLSDCELSLHSLQSLRDQKLEFLSLFRAKLENHSKLDLAELFNSCLHSDITSLLKTLNIGGPEPIENLHLLVKFKNLTKLVVSECPVFSTEMLNVVCCGLHKLQWLDISKTPVRSVQSVGLVRDSLEALLMHCVHIDARDTTRSHAVDSSASEYQQMCVSFYEQSAIAIRSLHKLRVLDLSDKPPALNPGSDGVNWLCLNAITYGNWTDLEAFDISGFRCDVDLAGIVQLVDAFIGQHAKLRFLGVLNTVLAPVSYLWRNYPRVKIAGVANRSQALEAVSAYWLPDRDAFTATALQEVYRFLQNSYDNFTFEQVESAVTSIELCMRYHPLNLPVQLAGSACLYHLCRSKRGERLHEMQISNCVDRCLDAATRHPTEVQLQKNVWLTLCNDFLLNTCCFDKFRTCEVALESMVINRDQSISRMTIAIVSILAPKIPTEKSYKLATNERYICYMIEVVRDNVDDDHNQGEFTLKFTLSALWNLTDENPVTCELFLRRQGLDAVLRVLTKHRQVPSIVTKVLGLLNNVAEVSSLQSWLLAPRCLEVILALLLEERMSDDGDDGPPEPRIDVNYFAAGILSNLLLSPAWDDKPCSRLCNDSLLAVVNSWDSPKQTMVAYRSFRPFFPLLARDDLSGAQLWAVWAIRHVCSHDKDGNYLRMLKQQDGYGAIQRVQLSDQAKPESRTIAAQIMAMFS